MRVHDYINTDLKSFSIYDNERSIPSIVDGFKPSQRKVIFGMIKRGEGASEIKVAQAASYVASVSDYHHGEKSLEDTIVGMAQDYTGSNNMNLLSPEGQFGSRLTDSAASSRYIFTYLHENFRKLFPKEDNRILEYQYSDGQQIEPTFYLPVIPALLVNGSKGIGTGFACNVLNYNPKDLKRYIKAKLSGTKNPKIPTPWYDGFSGEVYKVESLNKTEFHGVLEVINTTTIQITELPIGTYLDTYKKILVGLEDDGFIRSFDDLSTDEGFHFDIKTPRSTTDFDHDKLMVKFKLIAKVTENFTLWTENGNIHPFDGVESVLNHFVEYRLNRYEDRRLQTIIDWQAESDWLEEKLRFIDFYLNNTNKFTKKGRSDLFIMLEKENFTEVDKLLSQKIYSLTGDEIGKLTKQIAAKKADIKGMQGRTDVDLYTDDLDNL